MEYAPREQFLPFHNRRQRWAVLCTHRRAGKTVALVNDVILGALECPLPKPQLAYVGPTYKQTKRIAWQYLKDFAAPYMSAPPYESELKVVLHGNRTIYCLGADNADSLRGMYLDGGVGDEYALFKPSVFSSVIRPALSDRNGWWVFASTPRGKNVFYEEYAAGIANPDTYYTLLLRASESNIVSKEELADLRQDMDAEEYAQEYECSFEAALKGAIYADQINEVYLDGRVAPNLYDSALPVHAAFDLGFTDATVCVFWQEYLGEIRVLGAHATTGVDIHTHLDVLHSMSTSLENVWLPHDARAKNLQTGRSMVELFLSEDIRPRIVPNHFVRDRITATRRMFPAVWFDKDGCADLLEALKGYHRHWDEKLLRFDDTPVHNWCSDYADAFGYMCMVANGVKRTTERDAKIQTKLGYSLQQLFDDNARKGYDRLRIG